MPASASASGDDDERFEDEELRSLLSSHAVLSRESMERVRMLMISSTRRRSHTELQGLLAQRAVLSADDLARVKALMVDASQRLLQLVLYKVQ